MEQTNSAFADEEMLAGELVACESPVAKLDWLKPGVYQAGLFPEAVKQADLDRPVTEEPPTEPAKLLRATRPDDGLQGARSKETDGLQEPGADTLAWAGAGSNCADNFPLPLPWLLLPFDTPTDGAGACNSVVNCVT